MRERLHLLTMILMSAALMIEVFATTSCGPADQAPDTERRAPVYFNVNCHQEGVCSVSSLCWDDFKKSVFDQLDLLDARHVPSDQYFSDFIVSVALHMGDNSIFERFKASPYAQLGYHFHPTTADVAIRTNKIMDLEFEDAVTAYEYWEQAYYNWEPCLDTGEEWPILCGELDPSRLGGIQLMEQYFGKLTSVEAATIQIAPVGECFRHKYIARGQDIACWVGGPHSFYGDIGKMWMNDWSPASEPFIYVYKKMGIHLVKCTSNTFVEGYSDPVSRLKQRLMILPRDVPHIFNIHLVVGDRSALEDILDYIQGTFMLDPANQGSRFICGADIPDLVIPNPSRFTMPELEEAARYFLREYYGRPPAFVKYNGRFMSDAALFKALQTALQTHLVTAVDNIGGIQWPAHTLWPESVEVADFIYPPLGYQEDEVEDYRVGDAMSLATFAAAVMELPVDNRVPYQVAITAPEQPTGLVYANAAEFLTGMCELFLRLRSSETAPSDFMHMIPGYLVPISNLPVETSRVAHPDPQPLTRLDWYNDLALWTLEPLDLDDSSLSH